MKFNIQPTLSFENITLKPLQEGDFERLFAVASDPYIWKMHPNKERYRQAVFENFFKGALESGGAFIICDATTQEVLGSTRFYDLNEEDASIFIGYTFFGVQFWGKNRNAVVKKIMLDYIFQFVEKVIFHVGKENFRSIRAMEKLGAISLGTQEIAYFGEVHKMNVIFEIKKENWLKKETVEV